MKILFLLFFSLTFSISYSQTKVKELNYHFSYSDNNLCYAVKYDISMPHFLPTNKDILSSINDSIESFAKNIFNFTIDGACITNFHYYGDACDSGIIEHPIIIEMSYEIIQNSDKLVSVIIKTQETPGYGSNGGSGFAIACYNIDLLENKLITMDNLFRTASKKQLLKLIGKKFTNYEIDFDREKEYISLPEMSINKDYLTFHYKVYNGNSYYKPVNLVFAFEEIKDLIDKKYLWLVLK